MRVVLLALPLSLIAAPAMAAPPRAVPELPRELTDPAMADKLGQAMGALTRAVMDLKVGEVEAAVEGREPTAADKNRRVRDTIGDPALEQTVEAQAARSGRAMQAGVKAMAKAMPSILSALDGVQADVERAVANLPDSTYPKR